MFTENKKFNEWTHIIKQNKKKILISLFFLIVAIAFYGISGDYVTDHNWSDASDIILDHFGPYDLSIIFIGLFLFVIILFIFYPLIYKPNELSYVMSMVGLFLIVRSGFMLFTHLGVPHDAIKFTAPGILQSFNFTNDLFFSGHTGLPFLGFLVFNEHKKLRYFMLVSSIILGITVLLMHVHYSIDVFSAFFITLGVYKIGNYFLKKGNFSKN